MRYIIIGSGNISDTYAQAIPEIGGEVAGVVSRSCQTPASRPELSSWRSLDEVDVSFDAVCVATPNGLHHRGIIDAARLGKHALTEKPLDISIEAMDAAQAACREAGVTLAVAYQRRTAPDNQSVKRLLEQGAFGRVFAVDLVAKFFRPQSYYGSGEYRGGWAIDGGGPFMQQACHNLDIYTWFFGLPVHVVSMLDTFTREIEVEDHGAALMRHEDGMIGTVVASTATTPGFAARLEIHSEKGSIILTDDVITHWSIEGIDNPTDPEFEYTHDGATSAVVSDTTAHRTILKDFEQAVETGTEPIAGAASARLTTELILMIYQNRLMREPTRNTNESL
jgi:predicted dehydrogenase